VLLLSYARRDAVGITRVAGSALLLAALLFAAVVLAPTTRAQGWSNGPESAGEPTDTPIVVRVEAQRDQFLENSLLSLRLTYEGGAPREATALKVWPELLTIHLRGGGLMVLPLRPGPLLLSLRAPTADAAVWRGLSPTVRFAHQLTAEQHAALLAGWDSIAVTGRVTILAARRLTSLDLASGTRSRDAGAEFRLDSVVTTANSVRARLGTFAIVSGEQRSPMARPLNGALPMAYAIDAQRGEAIPLFQQSAGTSEGWLMLPGTNVSTSWTELDSQNRMTGVPEAPFAASRVVVLAWDAIATAPLRGEPLANVSKR
jgi:hypothetical protein